MGKGRFWIRLSLFVAPLLVLFTWLEWGLAGMPNSFTVKKQHLREQAEKIEVLFLGNSQMMKGIDPCLLPVPAYNLANVSQTLYYDSALLSQVAPTLPKLRQVVMQLSYFSLWQEMQDTEPFRDQFYARYWGVYYPEVERLSFPQISYTALYGPREAFRLGRTGFAMMDTLNDCGYQPTDSLLVNEALAEERIAVHHHSMRQKNVANNERRLHAMAQFCEEKGIKLSVLILPVHPYYLAKQRAHLRQRNEETLAALKAKGVQVIDCQDWEWAESHFCDADHLSKEGAALLTKRLVSLGVFD